MRENQTGLPFDDIRNLIAAMPGPDEEAASAARERDAQLTKPPGALGRLEDLAVWVARWQGRHPPKISRPVTAVFAGNHGVVAQGVAPFPPEVTAQMVANFQADGAAVNQICKTFDIGLKVFELALELPTRDISVDAALDEDECALRLPYGMEAIAGGCDLLCIGEMGIGNTTIAAALSYALCGGSAADWVGPGTGLDEKALPTRQQWSSARSICTKPILQIRLKCYVASEVVNSPPWPAPSWRPGWSASRSSSMVTSPLPLPPCCTASMPPLSIIA